MNILFISLFSLELNSSVSISSKLIIEGLISLGYKITIIMPKGDSSLPEGWLHGSKTILFDGTMKGPSKYYIINKIRSKLIIFDCRVHRMIKHAAKLSIPDEYYDYVISVSDPIDSHLFAKAILKKNIKYGRWIQHWGDPIYGNIAHKLMIPKPIIQLYEWNLMRRADKVVYVTPFSANDQKSMHKKMKDKIYFIPLPAENGQGGSIITTNKLKVAYAGDYNKYIRNILPLYEVCTKEDWIHLTIVGTGLTLDSKDNITVLPRVSYNEVSKIENEADVLVGICNLHGTQIPGKFFYKSSTNKHILVALEEDRKEQMKAYFESYNRFIICDNNPTSIKEALIRMRNTESSYSTPQRLLSINIAKELLS